MRLLVTGVKCRVVEDKDYSELWGCRVEPSKEAGTTGFEVKSYRTNFGVAKPLAELLQVSGPVVCEVSISDRTFGRTVVLNADSAEPHELLGQCDLLPRGLVPRVVVPAGAPAARRAVDTAFAGANSSAAK